MARRYAHVRGSPNEHARRLFVASEAVAHAYGGIAMVSRATGAADDRVGHCRLRQIERSTRIGNAQFEHINETIRHHLEAHEPVISVDTKKKVG